jgi:hypothetical protein
MRRPIPRYLAPAVLCLSADSANRSDVWSDDKTAPSIEIMPVAIFQAAEGFFSNVAKIVVPTTAVIITTGIPK